MNDHLTFMGEREKEDYVFFLEIDNAKFYRKVL
jgi:hypothetical protein